MKTVKYILIFVSITVIAVSIIDTMNGGVTAKSIFTAGASLVVAVLAGISLWRDANTTSASVKGATSLKLFGVDITDQRKRRVALGPNLQVLLPSWLYVTGETRDGTTYIYVELSREHMKAPKGKVYDPYTNDFITEKEMRYREYQYFRQMESEGMPCGYGQRTYEYAEPSHVRQQGYADPPADYVRRTPIMRTNTPPADNTPPAAIATDNTPPADNVPRMPAMMDNTPPAARN